MKLTRAQEQKLVSACIKGVKIDDLALRFGVSPRTVDRIISEHRSRGTTVEVKRGRPRKQSLRIATVPKIDPDPALVDQIVKQLLGTPFPYPALRSPEQIRREVDRLRALRMTIDSNGAIRPHDWIGIRICNSFFPNRFEAKRKGSTSAYDAWGDDRILRRAVRFQLRCGDPVTPHRVLRAVVLNRRTSSIFKPSVARVIYERYCSPGGRVWDPCAGFGGRLLGAHAAGVHYIGTDVEPRTVGGNRALATAINAKAEVYCARAEDFSPPEVDLVFTSPPYFDREQYSQADDQSWKRHGESLSQWVDGFIAQVAARAFEALRQNGHLVLNVADVKEGARVLPIVEMVTNAVLCTGFVHVETLFMPLAAINRIAPSEPVLVFKKPGGSTTKPPGL